MGEGSKEFPHPRIADIDLSLHGISLARAGGAVDYQVAVPSLVYKGLAQVDAAYFEYGLLIRLLIKDVVEVKLAVQ